ncbi:MAG: uracil-DNA glycosylase [Acidimicrobiales bacterium]
MSQLAALAEEVAGCTRCRLSESRTQTVFSRGDPDAGLVFIGEGPGAEEDRQGLPFVGRSGQLLDRLVAEEIGLDRAQVFVVNVVKCRPPANRDPKDDEITACTPYLQAQLAITQPAVIVTLGNFATRFMLGTTDGVTRLRGRSYPNGGAVIVPTFHPAAALRGGGDVLAAMRADLVRAKEALIAAGRLA